MCWCNRPGQACHAYADLNAWESSGWIIAQDPYGWFMYVCSALFEKKGHWDGANCHAPLQVVLPLLPRPPLARRCTPNIALAGRRGADGPLEGVLAVLQELVLSGAPTDSSSLRGHRTISSLRWLLQDGLTTTRPSLQLCGRRSNTGHTPSTRRILVRAGGMSETPGVNIAFTCCRLSIPDVGAAVYRKSGRAPFAVGGSQGSGKGGVKGGT